MKKTVFLVMLFIISLFIVSCEGDSGSGSIKPTKPFVVDNYIQDNMVFQQNTQITIKGTSEFGVKLYADLLNSKGKVVSTLDTLVDENNQWAFKFTSPKGSFDVFSLNIHDEYNTYNIQYDNIRFGEVVMFLGDSIQTDKFDEEVELDYLSCFTYVDNKGTWLDLEENSDILNEYYYQCANTIYKDLNVPVGLIINETEQSHLYEWLPLNTINEISPIYNYLVENNLYKETPEIQGDLSFLYENRIKPLFQVNVSKIILNNGVNDLNEFSDKEYLDVYFQSLICLVQSINDIFNNTNIGLLDIGSNDNVNTVNLRQVLGYASNYYTNVFLIPIFDYVEIEYDVLSKRIFNILDNELKVSQYANLLLDVDEKLEKVTKIKIELNNTDEIIIENDDEKIKYLNIYYNDPETGKVLLDIDPIIQGNFIIIDLIYEVKEIVDDEQVIVSHVYDYKMISIEYGKYSNLSEVNLYNEQGLPILPFSIYIK